jgi:hypothetical protein
MVFRAAPGFGHYLPRLLSHSISLECGKNAFAGADASDSCVLVLPLRGIVCTVTHALFALFYSCSQSDMRGQWLKENSVPAMYGVDTRALTKKLRIHGARAMKIRRVALRAIGFHNQAGLMGGCPRHLLRQGFYLFVCREYERQNRHGRGCAPSRPKHAQSRLRSLHEVFPFSQLLVCLRLP